MTQPLAPAVTAKIALHCDDELNRPMAFMATFGYNADDPWAVTITFHVPSGDVPWVVARSLLLEGLAAPSGDGDVRLTPCLDDNGHAAVELVFCSPEGMLRALARSGDLLGFLTRTWSVVAPGAEFVDVDELVASLIAS